MVIGLDDMITGDGLESEPPRELGLADLRVEVERNRAVLTDADSVLALVDRAIADPSQVGAAAGAILQRLITSEQTSAENRDRWMRSVAELENFRKRSANDRSRLLKYQYEALLRDLLPVLDNMERALDHSQSSGETGAFVEGIQMIAGMFKNLLDRYGVTEIASLDEPFDPNFHEAVSSAPVPGKEANMVVQALEKGYMYQDRLLRPSKVVISSDTGQ